MFLLSLKSNSPSFQKGHFSDIILCLNLARACRQVDGEKDVQLEQDGDGEEDGVDDETDEAHRPRQDKAADLEKKTVQHSCYNLVYVRRLVITNFMFLRLKNTPSRKLH